MNGIEKITARIEQDAGAEIAAMLQEAEAKAAEIRAGYEAQANAEADKAAEAGKRAAAQRMERLESAAQMEARTMVLSAKQACIDTAFERAKAQMISLPEEEYVDLLAKLAVRSAKTGREEIVLNRRDKDAVGDKVVSRANALLQGTASLTLAGDTADIEGGLILRDGQVEVNCAFETQLRMLRESMAAEVAGTLFD